LKFSSTYGIFQPMKLESLALSAARQALEQYAKQPIRQQEVEPRRGVADAIFRLDGEQFVVEVKSNARSDSVARSIAQLRAAAAHYPNGEPLLIVPSMGEIGAAICKQEGINWIDLNGNASVDTDHLRIYVRGRRDGSSNFAASEIGTNPFSKTASRVTHALLTDPLKEWNRSELESLTGLDKGYVSKIVAALSAQGYIEQVSQRRSRALRVVDPLVLLDAWRERYKPKHPRLWGLVAARSGPEALGKAASGLSEARIDYAISGLGAAAHYTNFGSFRRVDVYIGEAPPERVSTRLNIGTNERGRNIAFHDDFSIASIGLNDADGTNFVSPILAYLDLTNLPERSAEASDEMRHYLVTRWKQAES
jgi:hypothetical protein